MTELKIAVSEKCALLSGGAHSLVCGNSDYIITFTFDDEWDAYTAKTARFAYYIDGLFRYQDVLFEGNTVNVPALHNIDEVAVGVYAGDICTTSPARIPCMRSITDGAAVHDPPAPDVYNQLMEYLAALQGGGSGISELEFIGRDLSEIGIAETEE